MRHNSIIIRLISAFAMLSLLAFAGVAVADTPVADAGGPYDGVIGEPVEFDGTGSYDPWGDPLSYYWNFGDGSTGTGPTPSHTYSESGVYEVTLTVTNYIGMSDTTSTQVTIVANLRPVADPGGPYSGIEGSPVIFDGSGSDDPDGTIVSYDWDFGDGSTGTGVAPTHTYAGDGIYNVILTVTDNDGATDTDSTTAEIEAIEDNFPVADAGGPYTGNVGEPVEFDGTGSSDPWGEQLTYRWYFGDGSTSTGPTPSHTYSLPGVYEVRLIVTNYIGMSDTTVTYVRIEGEGGEGCPPGFWKSNADKNDACAWEFYEPDTRSSDVFLLAEPLTINDKNGDTITDPTLLQALEASGGGVNAMIRHAIAAMLNACSECVNYAINDQGEVIFMIECTLNGTPGAYSVDELHSTFKYNNEAGCPVNQHGDCVGVEGCTPGFWYYNGQKHNASAWHCFSPETLVSEIFSLNEPLIIRGKGKKTITNPTLLQALGAYGGGINAMVRQGVAAILNACSDCVQYAHNDPGQIISMIEDTLNGVPGAHTVDELYSIFAEHNEVGCPVKLDGECIGLED